MVRRLGRILLLLILISSACGEERGEIELGGGNGDLVFPVRETAPGGPEGEVLGQLTLVGNCLRVQGGGTDDLIIWLEDFSYEKDDDVVRVRDGSGSVIATTGDTIHLSGGQMTRGASEEGFEEVREAVGYECPGPYWLTEGVLNVS